MPERAPQTGALLIGIGNEHRGDDAAGLLVARRLQQQTGGRIAVVEHTGEPSSLLEVMSTSPYVLVVDAMRSGHAPGTVLRLDANAAPLPADLRSASTHALGLAETIELGRALGRLPPRLIVFAVEGRRFDYGAAVSAPVEAAIDLAAARILEELRGEPAREETSRA